MTDELLSNSRSLIAGKDSNPEQPNQEHIPITQPDCEFEYDKDSNLEIEKDGSGNKDRTAL